MPSRLFHVFLGYLPLVCAACTVVKVEGGKLRPYAGSLRVEPHEGARVVSVAARNYGVAADGHSISVGYAQSHTIIVPDTSDCAAVIILEGGDEEALAKWGEFFSKYPGVCLEGG